MAAFVLILGAALLSRPYYNWDMLMYIGSDQESVYADARASLPPEVYQRLVEADGYCDVVAADPQAFREQRPFYSVKPAYPALIALAKTLGMSGVKASVMISRVCLALLAALCCLWLCEYFTPFAAFALSSALIATPYLFTLARFSTPDALSALVLTGLSLLFLRPRVTLLKAAAIIVAVLCRPDAVVYITFILIVLSLRFREERRQVSMLGATALGTYLVVTSLAHSYSWLILFKQSFLGPNPYPASHPVVPSLAQLLWTYCIQLHPMDSGIIILMCVLAVTSLCCVAAVFKPQHRMFSISTACLLTLMVHWVVAPNSSDRFRSGYHLISLLFLVVAVGQLIAPALPEGMRKKILRKHKENGGIGLPATGQSLVIAGAFRWRLARRVCSCRRA